MKRSVKFIYWLPRILCILAILFISMFAIDSFEQGKTIWQQIGAFIIHLIPSLILLLILIISWKRELIGGIIFIVIGLGFSPWLFNHNYNMNNSFWMSMTTVLTIAFPFVMVGILFVMSYFLKKKNPQIANEEVTISELKNE